MKLTAQTADGLKLQPGEADRIWFDDAIPGFGLRVRDTGSRSWIFQYKIGKQTRRLVIGQASAIKLGRAREIASEYHAKVKLRHDPAAERRLHVQRASHTFGALVTRYLEQQRSGWRPGSYREIARHLEKYSASLHPLPVDAVDQRTIAERLTTIAKSGLVTANRVRASMSAMFTWGMREGLVLANPVVNTNKREEKARDRVLVDAELRAIWQAVGVGQYGTIVKLLILTGQRRDEIAGLRWSEIYFDRGVISLPGGRTKNGRPHELPMSAQVRALLSARPRVEDRDLVFGRREGQFSGFSRCKETLDNAIAELNGGPLAPWVLHDLRRSVATGMAEIGIQPHIIEAVLNHVSGHKGGIAGIYNRAQYSAEKAQALARWDEHVGCIVRGARDKVVNLRGRS
jgi:integrase